MNDTDMLDEYNFEKSIKNPYASRLKKSITIRLDSETISYFKDLSKDSGAFLLVYDTERFTTPLLFLCPQGPSNECVTCIAPFAHFLLRSNATSKKCDISNVKSTLLLGEAYYSFFFNLLFSNRR